MKTFPQAIGGAFGIGLLAFAFVACKSPSGVGVAAFGTVTGRVVDTQSKLPIAGATISIGNIVALTAPTDQGGFVLRNVPVGTQELRIDAIGWQRYRVDVTVLTDKPTDIGVIGLPSSLNTR